MAKSREDAGRWLDRERERRGISVREMSMKLDVAVQTIYDWQNGRNTVNDDRAEQIAAIFGLDIIDVRRGLGLWVPDDEPDIAPAEESAEDRASRLERMLNDALAEVRHLKHDREADEQRHHR